MEKGGFRDFLTIGDDFRYEKRGVYKAFFQFPDRYQEKDMLLARLVNFDALFSSFPVFLKNFPARKLFIQMKF